MKTRLQPVTDRLKALGYRDAYLESNRRLEGAAVDPQVSFPSYKSFDDLIDLERLKRLEGYLRERLEGRTADGMFWTGPYTLNLLDDQHPGSKVVWLTENIAGTEHDYYSIDRSEEWALSEHAEAFSEVMDFVKTLPFKTTGRILIMYDFNAKPVTAHRDHDRGEICHEFLWFRPNLTKPFYVKNKQTGERAYVSTYSAWFDSVNQFHGADATQGFSVSLRVDGVFSDELRARISTPEQNLASTPSYWAAVGDKAR